MFVSEGAVRKQVENICERFDVANRKAAVDRGHHHRLMEINHLVC